jgi:predicted MFS family arabinose efflux permease
MTGHLFKLIGNTDVKTSSTAVHELLPLLWLAMGTFATGTESFMIAALLPGLAGDLSVSITAAGQLMTVFALVYALSSPLLATATGAMSRRKVLLLSMAAFALFNFIAAAAVNYWQLMAARILLACAAGLYVPSASALAGAVVSLERRGTALAIVMGGSSIAVALGVPLGAVIGHTMGWRMTFVSVGILASLAVAGLLFGFPRAVGAGLGAPTLRERLAVIKQPPVLTALLVTVIWGAGAYTVYSYLTPYLTRVAGIEGAQISLMLFIWGCAAVTGLFTGGAVNDRLGARAMIVPALALLALAFASLSFVPGLLGGKILLAWVAVAIVVWGVAGWGFFPAQQARLIGISGVKVAPIVLSLNASSMYLGFSLGAALGSITLIYGSVVSLGWVAAFCEVVALAIVVVSTRPARALIPPASAGAELAASAAARCPQGPQAASGCTR